MSVNFIAVGTIITIAWMGLIVYYMYLSQQQNELEKELQSLQELVEKKELQS